MNRRVISILFAGAILALQTAYSRAAVLHVSTNSTNPIPPYAEWSTAAVDIQSAIDAAMDGDLVLVADGIY